MLLGFSARSAPRGCRLSWRSLVSRCAGFMAILAACASGAERGPCLLDLPVYDAAGNRLQFRVTRVTSRENASVNLLTVRPKEVRRESNHQLILDRSLLRRVIVVTLEDNAGAKVTQPVFVMQCPQRVSLRAGVSEAYGDVSFQTVTGRFAGCRFSGDWWIRAVNMFGASSASAPLEAGVAQDGSFSLSGQISGERHILVIGKDKVPLQALPVNVTVGKPNDLGTIDLSGRCPP
jgi:hypothetical protein